MKTNIEELRAFDDSESDEYGAFEDFGLAILFGKKLLKPVNPVKELISNVREQLQQPTDRVMAFVGNARNLFSQEIHAHPKRDTFAAAVTLGGLGLAVSAVSAHRHP